MIDKKLILLMAKIELKQKIMMLVIAAILFGFMAISFTFGGDFRRDFIPLFVMMGYFWLMVCSMNPFVYNGATHQNGNFYGELYFSWKYLYSIVKNRQRFIVAYCFAVLPFALVPLLFVISYAVYIDHFKILSPVQLLLACIAYVITVVNFRCSSLMISFQGVELVTNQRSLFSFIKVLLWAMIYFPVFLFTMAAPYIVIVFSTSWLIKTIVFVAWNSLLFFFFYREAVIQWTDENKRHPFSKRSVAAVAAMILTTVLGLGVALGTGAAFDSQLKQSKEPVFKAITEGNISYIQNLKINDPQLNIVNQQGLTPFLYSIKMGKLNMVEMLLAKGANLNDEVQPHEATYDDCACNVGQSALLFSIDKEREDISLFLIERGADLKRTTKKKSTALHLALSSCQPKVIERLIKEGLDVNAVNALQYNTFWYTLSNKPCLSGAYLLLEAGAEPKQKIDGKNDFYQYAAEKNKSFSRDFLFFEERLRKAPK